MGRNIPIIPKTSEMVPTKNKSALMILFFLCLFAETGIGLGEVMSVLPFLWFVLLKMMRFGLA